MQSRKADMKFPQERPDMNKPNHMQAALARLEQRRIELEREITDEMDRQFFSETVYVDLTNSIYSDPPLTTDEQAAWDEIVARF